MNVPILRTMKKVSGGMMVVSLFLGGVTQNTDLDNMIILLYLISIIAFFNLLIEEHFIVQSVYFDGI